MFISIFNQTENREKNKENINFNTRDFINRIQSNVDVINLMTSQRREGHMQASNDDANNAQAFLRRLVRDY